MGLAFLLILEGFIFFVCITFMMSSNDVISCMGVLSSLILFRNFVTGFLQSRMNKE